MNYLKKNKLLRGAEAPRLIAAGYEFQSQERSRRIFRRWSTVYLGTALTAIVAVGILLLSGSVSEYAIGTGSFWGRSAENLGALFLEQDFFDLSGHSGKEDESNTFQDVVDVLGGFLLPDHNKNEDTEAGGYNDEDVSDETLPVSKENLYYFDYDAVPEGMTPVIPMNLALSSYGAGYIHNATGYHPDTAALLAGTLRQTVDFEYLFSSKSPMVLIVHTHATESFCEDGATYCDTSGEYARSNSEEENMLAVGKKLATELEKRGITTLHCTVMHDEVQYKDSYRRSEESIRQYLEKYPTIRLVIDLHRDAVVQSDGDVVRPVTLHEGKAAAQLMCVVGSDWGGEAYPNWESNLALSLKLREILNAACEDICRPTYLKASTYNQELAPYSLLIEAGAGGNSLEEVERSMILLADALCELLPQM